MHLNPDNSSACGTALVPSMVELISPVHRSHLFPDQPDRMLVFLLPLLFALYGHCVQPTRHDSRSFRALDSMLWALLQPAALAVSLPVL